MKNTQSGFGGILIIILIALLGVGGGSYVYTKTSRNSVENKSSTNATSTVTIGVTSDTKTPITVEILPKVDSNGKKTFSAVVNPNQLNQAVSEKYNNPGKKREMIKNDSANIAMLFKLLDGGDLWDNEGSYKRICDIASTSLAKRAREYYTPDMIDFRAAFGVTIEDIKLSEYKCKSSDDVFVLTIPFTNEDGKEATVCLNQYGASEGVANFNFESLDADKLSCTRVK